MIDKRNACVRIECCILMVVILVGIAVGLAFHFTDGFKKSADEALQDLSQKIKESDITVDNYLNEDTHRNVTGPGDANTWASSSYLPLPGLRLRVLNALTEEWHPFYELAISDWENGNPDVLTLSSVKVSPAFNCRAEDQVEAVIKVCNGNYGKTWWRGLNTCVILDGTIMSCLAQMNEFYLEHATNEWKQYTMCHHLGQSFGLPHSDEEFWNRDSGNCLDYTNNPNGSMHPDKSNFEFLAVIYGSMDGTIRFGTSTNSSGVNASSGGVRRRQLRRQTTTNMVGLAGGKKDDDSRRTPGWVSKRIQSIHQTMKLKKRVLPLQEQQEVKSSSTPSGETHQIELGQGYSMVVHMLHADTYLVP